MGGGIRLKAWKRPLALCLGLAGFLLVYYGPAWPAVQDPMAGDVLLSSAGRGALGIFFLAVIWWLFEVLPVGVTSLAIGSLQVLFAIRPAKATFNDFMDPSVVFIFAALIIGTVFTKTGLTRRLAYRMLLIAGERTRVILLGSYVVTLLMTHVMAHSAVAVTIFPVLVTIYSLYGDLNQPSRFGKALFIGMAYVAGAGSVVTLLGAARGPVALGLYQQITGQQISFLQLTARLAPIGWIMVLLLWGYFCLVLPPERDRIVGLRKRVLDLHRRQGPLTWRQGLAALTVFVAFGLMSLQSIVPALAQLDRAALLLLTTLVFFIFKVLDLQDLEEVPWNIVLLFGGAMSLGQCLWQTGAAQWLALSWLSWTQDLGPFIFLIALAGFVLIITNMIMNVAAIAISLPVALVVAPYLNFPTEAVVYVSLAAAGMPFLSLVGAAPNAIAHLSKQFTSAEFFRYGIVPTIMLLGLISLALKTLWL
jgi:solute carrier family 13 (sodium-dependent dicarboxylate transporter), member 2/3/5